MRVYFKLYAQGRLASRRMATPLLVVLRSTGGLAIRSSKVYLCCRPTTITTEDESARPRKYDRLEADEPTCVLRKTCAREGLVLDAREEISN